MKSAALGFRLHTGWASAVAWAGPRDEPQLIDRRRIELAGDEARFVYHRAQEAARAKAPALIQRVRESADENARQALKEMIEAVRAAGFEPRAAAVAVGAAAVPDDLDRILASHALVHGAEGALYREAVVRGAEANGLRIARVPARQLQARAATALGIAETAIPARLVETGRRVGRPWAVDQKEATLLAWIALT
jgi:hypothetical protein